MLLYPGVNLTYMYLCGFRVAAGHHSNKLKEGPAKAHEVRSDSHHGFTVITRLKTLKLSKVVFRSGIYYTDTWSLHGRRLLITYAVTHDMALGYSECVRIKPLLRIIIC